MTAGAAARAPLVATLGDVVEHGGPLRVTDGMLLAGREAVDARRHVDALGAGGAVAHDHFGSRHVAVLREGVVLAEPGVLPIVLVSEDRVLRLAHQRSVLRCRVVGRRSRDVAVQENSELHDASRLSMWL